MSSCCQPVTGCTQEDSAFQLLARVITDGTPAVQSEIASISFAAYNKADRETVVSSGNLTVSATIFDTLQTDDRWTLDAIGYNFKHEVSHLVCAEPGLYRFEHTLTLTTGVQVRLTPFEVKVADAWS